MATTNTNAPEQHRLFCTAKHFSCCCVAIAVAAVVAIAVAVVAVVDVCTPSTAAVFFVGVKLILLR